MKFSPLTAISPIDGRYESKTRELQHYFSEFGLIRYRVIVEVEYFIAMVESGVSALADFPKERYEDLRAICKNFSENDALWIKDIEKTTNHDVKAVEYFLKDRMTQLGLDKHLEFVHFGLTSQDINNTSIPLSLKDAISEAYLPLLNELIDTLAGLSRDWKDISMLAKTHGQPASPTRLGKEIQVFVERLTVQRNQLLNVPFSAKFGGATGNFNAHHVAYNENDWVSFANNFVNDILGLSRSQTTTQIEHYDNLAALFDGLKRINTIILDLNRDMWTYISMEYFKQKLKEGEVGSSAMPHKVNPIDFENSEGNIGIANALFEHLSAKLPVSRLQRDLTDSTVLRTIGMPIAHTFIAFKSTLKGLEKLLLNVDAFERDLENNWAVVAEAIQTVLRREGYPKPYEALKGLTRKNEAVTKETVHAFVDTLDISEALKEELKKITPQNYTGIQLVKQKELFNVFTSLTTIMKKTLILLFVLFSLSAFSQPFDIQWSELERRTGRLNDVIARNSNDFFALRSSGGVLLGKLKATHHENLQQTANEALQLKAQGSMASYEGSAIVGNRFVVFLSDKKDKENKFFMSEYNDDITPNGDAIELASYSIDGKRGRFQGDFSVVTSRGRDYFAVIWSIPGKKSEEPFYGYKIFDKELSLVLEGEYELPFEQQYSARNGYYLSNTGDLFLTVTEYEKNTDKKRIFRNYRDFVATHILHISENGLEDMVIDLEGKRVEAMTFSSDNQKIFTIAGTYGDKGKSGVKGMFYLKADFKSQNVLAEGFEEFGADFITQDWSDRAKKKMDKKQAKGKDVEPALYNYIMRQLEVLPDGSVVGSMEQYYVVVTTYRDPRTGATTTTYTYYYNDIVTFRVGQDGGFDWLNKIDKYQVSTNDGGYFSSYERFVSNGKLYFIFNDNAANYDESGKFTEDEKISSSRVSKRKNVVGLVEIDLETGELSRESFFKRSELGAVAVPKLFNVDYTTGEVLLYAIMGKKEKFGVLKIGE